MFEAPKIETGPVPSKKEIEVKPEEMPQEEGPKKKFEVKVEVHSHDKEGNVIAKKASEVSKLAEVVEVEAASEEEAKRIALNMDFGKKIPTDVEAIKEIKTDKKDREKKQEVSEKQKEEEKLKDEAVKIILRAFQEKRKSLDQYEIKVIVSTLKMFDRETRERIFHEFKEDLLEPLAEKALGGK